MTKIAPLEWRGPGDETEMRLRWRDPGGPCADRADGKTVELAGFPLTAMSAPTADHLLLMAEPGCRAGCVPANRLAAVEVFADQPLKLRARILPDMREPSPRPAAASGRSLASSPTLLGLPGGSAPANYNDLPQLAAALRSRFTPEETATLLGGNYCSVFKASLG